MKLVVGVRRNDGGRLVGGAVVAARRGRVDLLAGRVELDFTHGGLVEGNPDRGVRRLTDVFSI